MTSAPIRAALQSALAAALGRDLAFEPGSPASGRVVTNAGVFFVKLAAPAHPVAAEADGLAALAAAGALRVPKAIAWGATAQASFIALEWLDLRDDGDWQAAGRAVAALHACLDRDRSAYGWPLDNSIGASPQINTPHASWADFWRECRLRPQFTLARHHGLASLAALETQACAASDALLSAHAPPPALLHGDLWRGNLAFDAHGQPVLFDCCVHRGDAETDLAMARLFGGFPPAFYAAYHAIHAPRPGADARLPLYQLYHVLNHANLFGGSYVAQAQRLIAALG